MNPLLGWSLVALLILDGQRLDGTKPFDLTAGPGSVVGLCEGRGAVAIRLFAGDGAQGQPPVWRFQSTGNEAGAGALTAGLDLKKHEITTRQVNHRPWPTSVFQVNDRDLAAETLGRIGITPAGK